MAISDKSGRTNVLLVVAAAAVAVIGCWSYAWLRPRAFPPPALAEFFSGRVVDEEGRGIRDARVRIRGSRSSVVTDHNGGFRLPREDADPAAHSTTLTASKPGYLIAGIPAGSDPLAILLKALPNEDCPEYRWVDPRPAFGQDHNCGNCHGEIVKEWQTSAHARSATGRKLLNLYAGSDWHGRPGRGWSLLSEHPSGATVCTACHAPTVEFEDEAYHDLRKVAGVAAQGVHCDYCHKIQDVTTENLGLTHGRFAQRLLRPTRALSAPRAEGQGEGPSSPRQLFFGPLDDVDRGEDAYSPLQKESRLCATCHEGTIFGVHVYSTYSEWLASPARAAGKQCQDCHMTPTGTMTNIAPGAGGIERDPATLASHDFLPGGKTAMLRRSLEVKVATQEIADAWQVRVEITARHVGHRVPTGFIDRHLLLVVEGQDAAGRGIAAKSGPLLPPACGDLAGRSGLLFAKLLTDVEGRGPIPFWRPAAEPIDTRLLPEKTASGEFMLPRAAKQVRVRLVYRPFWDVVTREKDWPADELTIYDETTDTKR